MGEGVGVEGGRVDERGCGRRCEGRRRKEPRKCDRKRHEGVIEVDGGVQQMVTVMCSGGGVEILRRATRMYGGRRRHGCRGGRRSGDGRGRGRKHGSSQAQMWR